MLLMTLIGWSLAAYFAMAVWAAALRYVKIKERVERALQIARAHTDCGGIDRNCWCSRIMTALTMEKAE